MPENGDRQEALKQLVAEFRSTYLCSEEAERRLSAYRYEKQLVKELFKELSAQAQQKGSGDFQDRVLYQLLPHRRGGRGRESIWGSITDIKRYISGLLARSGRPPYRREDWQRLADSLLELMGKLDSDPKRAEEAILRFASSPYRFGLEAGLLSPLFYCLNEKFLVINRRIAAVLNRFDRRTGTELKEYPESNRKLRAFLAARKHLFASFPEFDLFCRWLGGERDSFGPAAEPVARGRSSYQPALEASWGELVREEEVELEHHDRLRAQMEELARLLERKKQAVLYGPPGTGKTFLAQGFARWWLAERNFGRPWEKLPQRERKALAGYLRFVAFHPSYSYEEFVEGIRAVASPGTAGVRYEVRPGLFVQFAGLASADPKKSYLLIIDEINRGDIARIFGELLTLLEADKRGWRALLPYSGEPFSIPPNLYLLGTMNTADRSTSFIDIALRRRFAFLELTPDYSLLDVEVEGVNLKQVLETLNARIAELAGREKQIGHSYLMSGGKAITAPSELRFAFRSEIIPLLEEYFYQDFAELARVLGEGFADTERRQLRAEALEADEPFIAALKKLLGSV